MLDISLDSQLKKLVCRMGEMEWQGFLIRAYLLLKLWLVVTSRLFRVDCGK